jgi:predicted enzyme related to lactoylglutathione lyase
MRLVDFGVVGRKGVSEDQHGGAGTGGTDIKGNGVRTVVQKLEVVVIPVSDVDRAKEFYGGLGWRLDADFPFDNGVRIVQFTPPGSGCSIQDAPQPPQTAAADVIATDGGNDELGQRL